MFIVSQLKEKVRKYTGHFVSKCNAEEGKQNTEKLAIVWPKSYRERKTEGDRRIERQTEKERQRD